LVLVWDGVWGVFIGGCKIRPIKLACEFTDGCGGSIKIEIFTDCCRTMPIKYAACMVVGGWRRDFAVDAYLNINSYHTKCHTILNMYDLNLLSLVQILCHIFVLIPTKYVGLLSSRQHQLLHFRTDLLATTSVAPLAARWRRSKPIDHPTLSATLV
jgi:hypothetical protein